MGSMVVDRVGLGALGEVFPPELVDVVVAKAEVASARVRLLPARLVVYFLLARALFSPDPYREVLRKLAEPARREVRGWGGWHVPNKASVFRARQQVGVEPIRELLAEVGPVATEATPGAFWRGWRLMTIDGTTVEVADTTTNDATFGRPGHRKNTGPAGYPLARVMVLIESGTHVIVDAEVGAWRTSERDLAAVLGRSLRPGMLLLADRGLPGAHLWQQMAATGADLVWRVGKLWKLPAEEILPDGSWISTVHGGRGRTKHPYQDVRVRVIEYVLDDAGRDPGERYRLITTVTDPSRAPAAELAALYAERWESETTLAECKTHQIGARHVLTSKSPELVCQEIYAHLAVHAGLRSLMHTAALAHTPPMDPDRLSFSAALRAARRSLTAATGSFSP
jgi:hypothetical protein